MDEEVAGEDGESDDKDGQNLWNVDRLALFPNDGDVDEKEEGEGTLLLLFLLLLESFLLLLLLLRSFWELLESF